MNREMEVKWMEKRDLLVDLKVCDRATSGPWRYECNPDYSEIYAPRADTPSPLIIVMGHDPHDADFIVQAREGWPYAIERALKAEALAWELVAALQRISEILDNATCRCRCGFCEYFNAQKRADKALAKAKEVLGDGKTPPDYDL
jgi:hypothetical protein